MFDDTNPSLHGLTLEELSRASAAEVAEAFLNGRRRTQTTVHFTEASLMAEALDTYRSRLMRVVA